MDESGLDEERIEELARQMLILIRANYVKGPISRDRVYEALNALAFCTAVTIGGSDRHDALEWFSNALNVSLGNEHQE
jgi:hypothetical protein